MLRLRDGEHRGLGACRPAHRAIGSAGCCGSAGRRYVLQLCTADAGVVHQEADAVAAAFARGERVPWPIENAYYRAEAAMQFVPRGVPCAAPARVLLVSCASVRPSSYALTQTLAEHRALARAQEGFQVPVALAVGVGERAPDAADSADVEEVYALAGWEWLEPDDAQARLADALMVHTWPGLERTEDATALDRVERIVAQLPDAEGALPEAPLAMRCDLEAFLGTHDTADKFAEFIEAPAPAAMPTNADVEALRAQFTADDDSTFPVLFERVRREMERVRALPAGSQREQEAARVALAIERAMGG